MNEDYGLFVVIIMILLICLFAGSYTSYENGKKDGIAQKCAETQGRYDFCVQKVNWEVKK